MTANEDLLDDALRRAIALRRFTSGEARRAIEILSAGDRALADWMRGKLEAIVRSGRIDTTRFTDFQSALKGRRAEVFTGLHAHVKEALRELVKLEAQAELAAIQNHLPVAIELDTVPVPKLYAAAFDRPFASGAPLSDWFRRLAVDDQTRLSRAIQIGVVQGETTPQIVARVVGTRAGGFNDGALAITRRNADTVVRTAVNHVSNAARGAVWAENDDLFKYLRWVATLDGRTSKICASRDGALTSVRGDPLPKGAEKLIPPNARPPAHPNCRSTMVAVIDADEFARMVGERPFVRDTRTREARERDFRAEARDRAGARWSNMDARTRNAAVARIRQEWAREAVGQVPARTTYEAWLRRQPAAFQDEVLGKTKGALFRRGGVKLSQFVDRTGAEYNLEQLRSRYGAAFAAANL